jgi:hypothetical protein
MTSRTKRLLTTAVVFVVAVLVPALRHQQLKAEVGRYRAMLRAQGELMEVSQVLPPAVAREQDGTALFTNAVALFTTNENALSTNLPPAMRMVGPGKAMRGWQQSEVCDSGGTNSWAEIDDALAEDKAALDLLRKLPNRPLFDFQLNYDSGFAKMKLGPLAREKRAAQKLQASALRNLNRKDAAAAAQDIQTMLKLVNGGSHDRVLITELVRIAMAQITVNASWEFLQSTSFSEEQLAALQHDWSEVEFVKPFENAMLMERACARIDLERMRATNLRSYLDPMRSIGLSDANEGFGSELKINLKTALWRYWWSYPDELHYLQGLQAVLDATRRVQANGSPLVASAEMKKWSGEIPAEDMEALGWLTDPAKADFHFLISSSAQTFEKAFDKMAKAETARRQTVTAIALERFHLSHGRYPDQLAKLTPGILASVPLDPMDGKPLRYQLNPDGTFLLYSIGEDGVNNGGDPTPAGKGANSWQSGRDWVWPQPANAAEIKVWEARQRKSK